MKPRILPSTHRGLILWQLSLTVLLIGGANYVGTVLPERTQQALQPVLALAPATFYGWVFVTVGGVGMFSAYCRRNRDVWGYKLIALTTAAWGLAYVGGFVGRLIVFGDFDLRILGAAVIWGLFCSIAVTCSALPQLPRDLGSAA